MEQSDNNNMLFLEFTDSINARWRKHFEEFGGIEHYYFIGQDKGRLTIFIDNKLPVEVVNELNYAFDIAFRENLS